MRRFNLRSLRFGPDDELSVRLPVEIEPFSFGGSEYAVEGGAVELELYAARVGDRLTLKGGFETALVGTCQRCLGDARVPVEASGLEFVRHGDSEGGEDEGTETYAEGFVLDVERWVRDLIGDALPLQLLCSEDCAGLCPVCGADLNEEPEHAHDPETPAEEA